MPVLLIFRQFLGQVSMLCKALKHDFRRLKSLLSLIGSHPILSTFRQLSLSVDGISAFVHLMAAIKEMLRPVLIFQNNNQSTAPLESVREQLSF